MGNIYTVMLWVALLVVVVFNKLDRDKYVESMDKVVDRMKIIETKVDNINRT